MLKLIIGNKNYSSWSLRAWFYLKQSGVPFEEIRIPLFQEGFKEKLAEYTPAGRVPVLIDEDIHIWDSLAICGYVSEQFAASPGWPTPRASRALARSIVAEMHAGFMGIRGELPQNIRARNPLQPEQLSEKCRDEIRRVQEIWLQCRRAHWQDGPWLFGVFTTADAFYAPVALRFATYDIDLTTEAAAYVGHIQSNPHIQQWAEEAAGEPEKLDFIDNLVPYDQTPLS